MKISQSYLAIKHGLKFDDYPGFQPKIAQPKQLFDVVVVGFGPKKMPGKMCYSVRQNCGHTIVLALACLVYNSTQHHIPTHNSSYLDFSENLKQILHICDQVADFVNFYGLKETANLL